MLRGIRPRLKSYAFAVVAVASTLLLTLILHSLLAPTNFLLFYAAVAISAWYGGMKAWQLAKQVQKQANTLEAILSASVDRIYIVDSAGRYRYVSAAEAQVLGFKPNEIVGKTWRELGLPPEIMEPFDAQRQEVFSTNQPLRSKTNFSTASGIRHYEYIIAPLHNPDKSIEGVVVISRDTTDRTQAESALQQSEERYRAFVEQSSEGIWRFELEEPLSCEYPESEQIEHFYQYGYLAECNHVMAQMYGFSRAEEIVGARLGDFIVRSDTHNVEYLRSFIRSGYRLNEAESHELDNLGSPKYFLNNLVGIVENGFLVRAWGTQRDVSDIYNELRLRKQAEEALRESEEQFRQLAENIHEVFWIADPRTPRTIYISPAYEEIWGRPSPRLYQQPESFLDAIHLEDRDRFFAIVEQQLRGEPTAVEYRIVRPDGSIRWLWDRGFPIKDGSGQVYRVAGIAEDITERKQIESEQRRTEEHLRLVIQNMPVMMDAFDADWNIIVWNRECERVTGYSAQEIIGNPRALELLYPDAAYRQRMIAEWSARGNDYRNWEWDITGKDGSVKTVSWSNISDNFPIPGWVAWGIGVDITSRKQAEESLKQSREQLQMAFDAASLGTWDSNILTGRIIWSGQHEQLFGMEPGTNNCTYEQFIWRVHPDDRELVEQKSACSMQEKTQYEDEYRVIWPDGSVHWVAAKGRFFYDENGKPLRMSGAVMDVTLRKQAEEAVKESQERFRKLAEKVRVIPWEADAITGRFTYVGPQTVEIFGYTLEDWYGDNFWFEHIHPQDREWAVKYCIDCSAIFDNYEFEYRMLTADGRSLWLYDIVNVVRGEDGPQLLRGFMIDITQRKQAEEALRQREDELRLITNAVPVLISYVDRAQRYRFNNKRYEEWFGQDSTQVYGKHVQEVVGEAAYETIRPYIETVLSGEQVTYESKVLYKHRGTRYISATYVPQLGDGGEVEGFVALVSDISDRKQALDALRESEERFRLMADTAPVMIWMSGLDKLCYYFNKTWLDFSGRKMEQEMGNAWAEGVHHDDLQRCLDIYVNSFDARENFQMEYRLRRFDGEYRWILDTGIPRFTPEGSFQGFIGSCIDISDRKQAEEALQETNQTLQALIQACPLAITVFNFDGKVKLWNPSAERIFGWSQQEAVGHFLPSVPEDKRDEFLTSLDTVKQGQALTGVETRRQKKDGLPIDVALWAALLRDAKGNISCMSIVADITERKHLEAERAQLLLREQAARAEAEAANRMKDEFLATLSHELRTPLNSMLGWTQLLRTRKFNEATTTRALETIDRNTKALAQLIEDVLDVSRIITGKLRLNVRPVELVPAISAAIDTVQPAADAKEIRIESILDPLAGKVLGDSNRLQQIVWNLLSNAVKFTPIGGSVEVLLSTDSESVDTATSKEQSTNPKSRYVQIRVSDTGKGIASNFLPYVFERFRQADSSIARSYGGLGLGLAIVRHLVELQGGTVHAQSPGEGQGSTFIVQLPLLEESRSPSIGEAVPTPDQEGREEEQNVAFPPTLLSGLRILVVDDEPDARDLLITMLGEYGAEVIAVAGAGEALEALQRLKPNLLVSDIGMPEVDGYALIRQVRMLDAQHGGQIPAAALTAYARAEDRTQAMQAGFQTHVPKPVEPAELIAVVASLAGRVGIVDGC